MNLRIWQGGKGIILYNLDFMEFWVLKGMVNLVQYFLPIVLAKDKDRGHVGGCHIT